MKLKRQEIAEAVRQHKPLAPWQDERTEDATNEADKEAALKANMEFAESMAAEMEVHRGYLAFQSGERVTCEEHALSLCPDGTVHYHELEYLADRSCTLCRWILFQGERYRKELDRTFYIRAGREIPDHLLEDSERTERRRRKKAMEDAEVQRFLTCWKNRFGR